MPTSKEFTQVLNDLHLLTNKPIMYAANINEVFAQNNDLVSKIKQHADKLNIPLITICASIEAEIISMSEVEQLEFLENLGFKESGLKRLIKAGYELLNLQTFFTAGKKEVKAWTIETNSTAPIAAGKIHSDFQKGFIRAEVVGYDDFIKHDGFQKNHHV